MNPEFLKAIQTDFKAITMPYFTTLLCAVACDILLGTAAAWAKSVASSATSRIGMLRKAALVGVTLAFAVADGIFPQFTLVLPIGTFSITMAGGLCVFWIVTEAISILEKLTLLGVPIPRGVRERLLQVRKAFDSQLDPEDEKK